MSVELTRLRKTDLVVRTTVIQEAASHIRTIGTRFGDK